MSAPKKGSRIATRAAAKARPSTPAKRTAPTRQAALREPAAGTTAAVVTATGKAIARKASARISAAVVAPKSVSGGAMARLEALALPTQRVAVALVKGQLRVIPETIEIDQPTTIVFHLDGSLASASFRSQVGQTKGFQFLIAPPPKAFGAAGSFQNRTEVRLVDWHTTTGSWQFELTVTVGNEALRTSVSTHSRPSSGPIIINK